MFMLMSMFAFIVFMFAFMMFLFVFMFMVFIFVFMFMVFKLTHSLYRKLLTRKGFLSTLTFALRIGIVLEKVLIKNYHQAGFVYLTALFLNIYDLKEQLFDYFAFKKCTFCKRVWWRKINTIEMSTSNALTRTPLVYCMIILFTTIRKGWVPYPFSYILCHNRAVNMAPSTSCYLHHYQIFIKFYSFLKIKRIFKDENYQFF